MRCALLFLMLVGCSQAPTAWQQALRITGEELVTKQDQSLTILKENTTALAAIKSQIESLRPREEVIKSEDTSPADNANDSHPVTRLVAEAGDVPLFVSLTVACAPCNLLKKDYKAGKFAGFDVTFCVLTEGHKTQLIAEGLPAEKIVVEDIDASPFPAIRYQSDTSPSGWVWHTPRGYSSRVLMQLRSKLLGEVAPVEYQYPQASVLQKPVASQGDLVALHNQLHGGGQWSWPGDLATHMRNTHGVQIDGASANYSGNQIVSSRSSFRSFPQRATYRSRSNVVSRSSCPTCPR
jgi:hypothetical protein